MTLGGGSVGVEGSPTSSGKFFRSHFSIQNPKPITNMEPTEATKRVMNKIIHQISIRF